MEITINIPQNDYVQPTEARQEVVQEICNLLLEGQEIVLREDAPYRLFLITKKYTERKYISFSYNNDDLNVIRIRGVEIQAAFDALLKANYYIHGEYVLGYKHVYKCSKTPYINGSKCSVIKFGLFID